MPEAPINRDQQVIGLGLLNLEIGVANNPEQVGAHDVRAGKQLLDVRGNDILDKRECGSAGPLFTDRARNGHEPRQHVGHLHAGEFGAAGMADDDRKVLAAIRHVRKRVARVERQRCQHRADFPREVPSQIVTHRRRPISRFEEANLLIGQPLTEFVPYVGLVAQHAIGADAHRLELCRGAVPVRRHVLEPLAQLLQCGGNANHEELVEVGRGNGQELDAFEERVTGIAGLSQHPFVELEPAQFTIDVEGRVPQVGRIERRADCRFRWPGRDGR